MQPSDSIAQMMILAAFAIFVGALAIVTGLILTELIERWNAWKDGRK